MTRNLEKTAILTVNPLSANPTKWSNTLKQCVGNLPTNCLSVFDHFMNLALKGLKYLWQNSNTIKYCHAKNKFKRKERYLKDEIS